MRPHLGDIENVPREIPGLLRCQNLHLKRPGRVIPTLNGLVQITGGVIGVGAADAFGLLPSEVLDSLVRLKMVLHPEVLALVIVPFEGMAAVAVHVAIGSWRSPAREENSDLVNGFRCERQEVPEHVGILTVGCRVPLLGVDEVGELERVPNEEHRCVVAHKIVVTLLGVELHGETPWVSCRIG